MFINGHRPVPERKLHRMRLTNFSDYALRVLMYAAAKGALIGAAAGAAGGYIYNRAKNRNRY